MRSQKTSSYALLGLLLNEPHHGYELYQDLSDPAGLGQVWHLGMSQMYAELKVLETKGWVKATLELQDARPSKKVFELTKVGRTAFREWMTTPARGMREMRIEFIVRLYFARMEGTAAVNELIKRQEKSLCSELESLQQASTSKDTASQFEKTVFSFRTSQIQSALTWLKSFQAQNTSLKPRRRK
ncbi:MAG: PadR family transcriptional regulator [Chloroflexi bacterium]|nr:PadR family transcriptional regulator [Chloroflexota bacterium]